MAIVTTNNHEQTSHPLHDLRYVNTVLSMLYDKDGNYRAGFKPEEFYNAILLDSLRYGEENYVHLKYCETVNIKKGMKTAKFRRWAGMTPTLRPLREGIPPMPDKHAYETMEVGNVFSFGRWSEYTDEIDNSVVNEIVAERSVQYGENANQIKELYARKTWLCSPNVLYANFKESESELVFGDTITLDDLRFMIARMKRIMVKPIGGKFNYICSQEFINDLIDDPRVQRYMEIEQTTGKLFTTGEPFDLFELSFIPTLLDEFAYPDVEYPHVYDLDGENQAARYYHVDRDTNSIYYLDIHQDFVGAGTTKIRNVETGYLQDGTAIEDQAIWNISNILSGTTNPVSADSNVGTSGAPTSTKVIVKKQTYTIVAEHGKVPYRTYSAATVTASAVLSNINTWLKGGKFYPLPIHRGILFGDEAMIKINMEGISDAPRIIVKALGSAGVSDPLDQRQSIGYRVDGFGLAIKRPEALCVTYSIPTNAEFAAITAGYIKGNPTLLHNEAGGYNDFTKDLDGYYKDTPYQSMRVDAINDPRAVVSPGQAVVDGLRVNDFEPSTNAFPKYKGQFLTTSTYKKGDVVLHNNEVYVFVKDKSPAGEWDATKVKKMTPQALYDNLLADADKKSVGDDNTNSSDDDNTNSSDDK